MIYRFFYISLLTLLISSCASKKEKEQLEEQTDLYFSMGTNALINKNYTIALTHLLKAEELAPNRSDIKNNLGMAYYFKEEKILAKQFITKSLELDPKNSDARSNLASIYVEEKKYDLARKEYQNILKDLTYPKQYLTYYNLGKIEYDQNNNLKAKNFFLQSVKENPNACTSNYYVGLIEMREKNYKKAQEHFQQAYYGTCYTNEYPLFYHALSLERDNNNQAALGRYQELIDRFPSSELSIKAKMQIKGLMIKNNQNPNNIQIEQAKLSLPGKPILGPEQNESIESQNKNDNEELVTTPEF